MNDQKKNNKTYLIDHQSIIHKIQITEVKILEENEKKIVPKLSDTFLLEMP
jgi:hypothetical protein